MDINQIINQGLENFSQLSQQDMILLVTSSILEIQERCTLETKKIEIAIETLEELEFFITTGVKRHTVTNKQIRTLIEVLENMYERSTANHKKEFKLMTTITKQLYKD